MKVLVSGQKYFRVFGIYQPLYSNPFNYKNVFIWIGMILATVLLGIFLFTEAESLVDFGSPFYIFAVGLNLSVCFPINVWKIFDIIKLIKGIEQFIEKRLDESSKTIYKATNETAEKLSGSIYRLMANWTVPGLIFPPLTLTYVNYLFYNLGEESFYLPYPAISILKWKSPIGYLFTWTFQSVMGFYLIVYGGVIMCVYLAFSLLLLSILKDITKDLSHLKCSETTTFNENRKLVNQFRTIAQNYADVKQLTSDFNDIYTVPITGYFLWSLTTIACSLFILNSEISRHLFDAIALFTHSIFIFWSLTWIIFYCELGERISDGFDVFNDTLWQSDWYSFPNDIQRMLIIVIMTTKEPTILHGFGNALCTREALKLVLQTGFSYFMVLRQFDT